MLAATARPASRAHLTLPSLATAGALKWAPVLVGAATLWLGCARVGGPAPEGGGARLAAPAAVGASGDTAVVFAPGVVSTGDVFASSFTPDGRTVYFTKASEDRTRLRIMRSTLRDDGWSAPVDAPFSDAPRSMDPFVSPDGRAVYFSSPRRRDASANDPDGDWDTWVAERAGDGFGPARRLIGSNSERLDMYPSVTRDGVLYFASSRGSEPAPPGGRERVTVWRVDVGHGGPPEELGPEVNARDGVAFNPYVSRDGRVLVFAGERPGQAGRGDLYVSVRRGNGWGEAVSLGPRVNTADLEFCPSMSPDGRTLFFTRARFDGQRRTGSDIYAISVDAVPALRAAFAEAARQ